jgi:prepilin-type N-terminal cleavage/methylation domain-containing protein
MTILVEREEMIRPSNKQMPASLVILKRGFTLIELLVVISIIAILAAILFPVFAQAKGAAKKIVCVSNIRQIGMATLMYENDYDDVGPCAAIGAADAGLTGGWMYYSRFPADDGLSPAAYIPSLGSIYSYIKNAALYQCPVDNFGKISGNSYAINECVTEPNGDFESGISTTSLDSPSDTAYFLEEYDNETAATGSTDDGIYVPFANGVSARHNLFSTFDFADGHAKAMRPEQFLGNGYEYKDAANKICQ